MLHYLVAYDIADPKRRWQIAKVVYGYALGGQKSALEVPQDQAGIVEMQSKLAENIDTQVDKVNIVRVAESAILLGKATQLEYDDGMVLL